MSGTVRAKVIGAGGYGGVGIVELLHGHPRAEIACLADVADVGRALSDLYPHLRGFCDLKIVAPETAAGIAADVVFCATPDGVGMRVAPAELERGAKVIDYSGDFRFNSTELYAEYARRIGRDPAHACPELLPESVYGLPECRRAALSPACRLVGNPGCFAVSCILGLAPAVKAGAVSPGGIVCDCKTGVSGAGKKPAPAFHYPARYESMNAYRFSGHQHVCEIEYELGRLAGTEVRVTFTPQVVPVCRGIMSTLYGELAAPMTAAAAVDLYREHYRSEPFVRVWDGAAEVRSDHVSGTNFCNLVVTVDGRTGRLRVVSYIDNLVKGQAGSALQNMNLLFGLPETCGLDRPGRYP